MGRESIFGSLSDTYDPWNQCGLPLSPLASQKFPGGVDLVVCLEMRFCAMRQPLGAAWAWLLWAVTSQATPRIPSPEPRISEHNRIKGQVQQSPELC